MHAIFMLYGKKECVDILLRDMTAQKLNMKFWKGDENMIIPVECQVRTLPFGIYEFVFPKEYMDIVLTTLRFHLPLPYNLEKEFKFFRFKINPLKELKKFLNIEDAPKDFKTDQKMLWMDNDISIIPLGIRKDRDITNPNEEGVLLKGWTHEGI